MAVRRIRNFGGTASLALLFLVTACEHVPVPRRAPARPPLATTRAFVATAYAQAGLTASGVSTHRGLVAADPKVLPLGTRIRIHDAGVYSGEYLVADTGGGVHGFEIDIWMESHAEALRFGRKRVTVEVLRYGER